MLLTAKPRLFVLKMLKWYITRISKPVFPIFLRTGSSSGNNFSLDELSVVTFSLLRYESPVFTPNSKPRLPILSRSLMCDCLSYPTDALE